MAELAKEVFLVLVVTTGFVIVMAVALFIIRPVAQSIFRWTREHNSTVRVETLPATGSASDVSRFFQVATYSAFARFRATIAILENRLALRDSSLGYFTDCGYIISPAERLDVQLELGPVTVANVAHLIWRYLGGRDFVLQISTAMDSPPNHRVFASLSLNQKVWRTWDERVTPAKVDSFCQRLVQEVVWVTSQKGPLEAQAPELWSKSALNLLEGLGYLSDFLMSPTNVNTLEKAVGCFDRARREPWTYYADLLGTIALISAQGEPRRAAERMQELMDTYDRPGPRHMALVYNNAVAKFRLYDSSGDSRHYDEAVQLFRDIGKPRLCGCWWLPLKRRARLDGWILYLLAQAGIANSLAHKLNAVDDSENDRIMREIRDINCEVTNTLDHLRKPLGSIADDVEWRMLNAEAVAELFRRRDPEKGIAAAQRGLQIDPRNLPLKANLGSLLLLEAEKAEERNETEERTRAVSEAKKIFVELQETGWDTGFVNYRLGRIRRVQGDFGEAIKHLEFAKGKDVSSAKIEAEIEKARAGDSRFRSAG